MEVVLGVDPAGPAPLHRQIYESLRSAILTGRLHPGDRLPGTRSLAEQLSLSRTTVTEAYDQLEAEGYLQGRHGSGTYVATNLPDESLRAERREAAGPATASRPARLSVWGRRIAGEAYRPLFRAPEPVSYRYDFRPHRIAQDRFPWNAWRAAVERALARDRSLLLSYPPSAGHPELVQAVTRHISAYRAVACTPEQVVIVNGSQQGLNLLSQLLLESGDRVAVEDPGYPTARLAFEARGLAVSRIPVDEGGMAVDRLSEDEPHRLVHVTPSRQDPTGATLSLGRRLALLNLAGQSGCLVFEDDYDSEFRYEGRPVESLQGLDEGGHVVYAGSFSKSVLPGLRIGFVVLPGHLVAPFVAAKSLWDSGAPMLEQAALAEFIGSGDFERHIRRMRRLYRGRRDALLQALRTTFGERVLLGQSQGGLNVLVTLDVGPSEEEVLRRAECAGIGLRGASGYFAHSPERPTFLMGFAGQDEAEISHGVQALERALASPSAARSTPPAPPSSTSYQRARHHPANFR